MNKLFFKTKDGLMYYKYICNDGIEKTLVFLHGWGTNNETFKNVVNKLNNDFNILLVDFLGFGESDSPLSFLSLDDYTNHIYKLLLHLKIEKPILVGHSFGGRVSINFASKYEYEKVFVCGSPAFKNMSISYYLRVLGYKIKKNFYRIINKKKYYDLIQKSGSTDYKACNYYMKGTFKKIIRTDLRKELESINKDCKDNNFIIFSSVNDSEVKYKDQIEMYKITKGSKLYPFYNSDHFMYITEEEKFIRLLKKEIMNYD